MAEVGLQNLAQTLRNQNLNQGMMLARPTSISQPITINQNSDSKDIINTIQSGDNSINNSLNKIFNVLQQQFMLQNQMMQQQRIAANIQPKEFETKGGGINATREKELGLLKEISDKMDNLDSGSGSGGGLGGTIVGGLSTFFLARFIPVLITGLVGAGIGAAVGTGLGRVFGGNGGGTGTGTGTGTQPGTGTGTQPGTGTETQPQLKGGGTKSDQAMRFFMEKGWSKEQSAGLVANLQFESGSDELNTKAIDYVTRKQLKRGQTPKNPHYGIAQWDRTRQETFRKRYGRSVLDASLEEQLDFVNYELTQGSEKSAGEKLKQAKTTEESAYSVVKHYERPSKHELEGSIGRRTKKAEKLYNQDYTEQPETTTTRVPNQPGTSPTTLTTEPNDKNFVSVIDQQQKGAKYRRDPITKSLEEKLSESIRAVYGEGYRGKVYSGGQHGEHRTGTHRHDEGGAADLRIVDSKGKVLKGNELSKLAQYWRARDFGGVGLEMGKGGIHLDERKEEFLKKHGGSYDWSYGTRTKEQLAAIRRGEKGELPELADPSLVGIAGGYKKDEDKKYSTAERVRPEGGRYAEEESEMEETNEPVLKEYDSTSKAELTSKGSLAEAQQKYYEQSTKLLDAINKNTKKLADKSEEKKESETATKEEKSEAEKTMDSLFDEGEPTATKESSTNEKILSNAKKVFGEDAVTNEEILSNAKKVFGEDAVSERDLIADKEVMSNTGTTPFGNMGGIIQPIPGGGIFGQMGNMGGFGNNPFGTIQGVLGGLGSAVGMGAGIAGMGRSMGGMGGMGGIYGAQGAIGGIQGILGSLGMQSPVLGGLGQAAGSIGGVMSSVEMMKNMGNMGGGLGGIMGGIGAASAGVGALGGLFETGKGLFGGMFGGDSNASNVPTQGRFGQRLADTPKEESMFGSIGESISNFFGGDSNASNVPTQGRFGKTLGETPTISSMGAGSDIASINAKYAGTSGSARGEALEGMSRNVEEGKEDRMSSDQPIIVEGGGGSGGASGPQGGGSGTPSPSGVMGMGIEVRDPAMWTHMFEFSRIV